MKVIFRVDGNNRIGLGHLTRCLAIAEMLKHKYDILFICKEITENFISEITNLGFEIIQINSETEFFKIIKPIDVVVLDHYELDSDFQYQIKQKGCKLVCIDDIQKEIFWADLIINHAPNVKASAYQAKVYTQYALGLDYAMLRPVFLQKGEQPLEQKLIRSVFVCFGGSDIKNITQTVLSIVKLDKRFEEINIIVGMAYNELDQLNQHALTDNRIRLYSALNAKQISELIAKSDLCIVPASGILLEVLSLGKRVISGMYVSNQLNIFEQFKAMNAFESAENFSVKDINHAINQSFKINNHSAKKLIDGKSGERILKSFDLLFIRDSVSFKRITIDDLNQTYLWAKNTEIRKFFHNKDEVSYEDHCKWFTKKINDKNCFYFIAYQNEKTLGSIRFDVEDKIATVSYLIDTGFQGVGLGTVLLSKGVETFISEVNIEVDSIYGEVLKENIASIKVFQKLGFQESQDVVSNVYKFEKKIENG